MQQMPDDSGKSRHLKKSGGVLGAPGRRQFFGVSGGATV
jgi:hypothetical protein